MISINPVTLSSVKDSSMFEAIPVPNKFFSDNEPVIRPPVEP